DRLGAWPIPIQLPDGAAEGFAGIVDLVDEVYLTFGASSLGRDVRVEPIPARLLDEAKRKRARMIEALAEIHDPLAASYMADEAISPAAIREALRAITLSQRGIPVLCGAALRNCGVQPVLDAVCAYLPSPRDIPRTQGTDPRDGSEVSRASTPDEPFAALVFKVTTSSSADLFYLRVYSGRLEAGERVLNPRTGEKERLRRLLRMSADRGEPIDRIEAGDIVAAAALHGSGTGDTLCSESSPILLEPIRFPDTVVSVSIEPRTTTDRDRLTEVLKRLLREDPTLCCSVDPDTAQTLLSGMGELHLEVTLHRMQRDFGLEVNYGKPRVSYHETVRGPGAGSAEYRRQVAGQNLFARVQLGIEPLANGTQTVDVIDRMRPGTLPQSFLPAVIDSARNAAEGGGQYGYPIKGVRVSLLDASYADVGQPEVALNSATSLAFREACRAAGAVVLE
ncbi:MAG: EF-Tu/IF-2/RF-3 family GTPase, partial [Vicinamibacteria bacterium]